MVTGGLVDVHTADGRRAATYFVLQHLHGARGVMIPHTAFLDDEGVLVEWLFCSHKSSLIQRKKAIQNTNLLLFELQLQELADAVDDTTVAVVCEDTLRLLDETQLDAYVRTLCARETDMFAPVARLPGPRRFNDGAYCLQAYTVPHDGLRYFAELHAEGETRRSRIAGGIAITAAPYASSLESGTVLTYGTTAEIESTLQAVTMQVFSHLQKTMQVEAMRLEFVFAIASIAKRIASPVLLGAQWIHETNQAERPTTGSRRDSRLTPTEGHAEGDDIPPLIADVANGHVCRFCRRPREAELSAELAKTQATLRHTIGKLQARERTLDQSRVEAATMQQKIRDLDSTVAELHNQLKREGAQSKFALQQLTDLLAESERQHHKVQASLELEESARTRAEAVIKDLEATLAQLHQTADAHQKLATIELKRAQTEAENHLRSATTLRAALTKMTKERDDCLSFRAYLYRRLADTSQPGVEPPKRVAGGFWSYPTPSPENVAEVVRVLVDSQRSAKAKAKSTKSLHE
ncbi:hypothetical protein SPRG_04966 [Saprolegnia parasitica CBS 223.65]|uniref:Uncharacterized protein n=1 Tax=Saprolegnia parasitica (strain CBS 223.65) TaxID=695850 RepID=A0A067CL08_SAPPC|nr:hypothetical protein SPRG_04966 [Saprolegnia parasitica CBS 223.65]KDO29900.1 hypothetical protein SPRG_04966 [Saprolegnia parasitica CBS 223.65]|eukprot:XP_012199494.1 hypothetical protein SPRG_04966 [Saprolegnia parasitica CBS 223.65]